MPLVDFYKNSGADHTGRTLNDILSFSDRELEAVHDYIQWLFPLPECSRFQPHIPVLTQDDIEAFKNSAAMQDNMRRSFSRILSFYGFEDKGDKITLAENFNDRVKNWMTPRNHNFLRITRILRSMTFLGLKKEAGRFFAALDEGCRNPDVKQIVGDSYQYWADQVNGPKA